MLRKTVPFACIKDLEKSTAQFPEGCNIANGEKLYIDTEVDTGKDGIWGHTEAGDVSGWVNIAEATNTEESTVELVT